MVKVRPRCRFRMAEKLGRQKFSPSKKGTFAIKTYNRLAIMPLQPAKNSTRWRDCKSIVSLNGKSANGNSKRKHSIKSVECLSTAFATFSSLGYSGQVVLNRGEGDLDIRNYGIKILVKFRDRDMLQPLKASVQSGGEKSVSTALYILALVLFLF